MKRVFFASAIMLAGLAFVTGCGDAGRVSPGPSAAEDGTGGPARYTCPMHPHYISTDPDGACPICGMALVPANDGARSVQAGGAVAVAADMIQTFGVRTTVADYADFGRTVRAFGVVEADQRLETVTASRIEGWIRMLSVRAEGDAVQSGDLLYQIYSPGLIAAQKDYLNARLLGDDARRTSARQRMRALGMQDAAIARLDQNGDILEETPVFAEASGIVSALEVREGDYIRPGAPILRLQSYAEVWILAAVPESDLPLIRTGQPVRIAAPSAPAAAAEGVVNFIYPTIDPRTRTAQVRVELDNPSGDLRPGAYADIAMDLGARRRLSAPAEAILRDSRGAHVMVALGEGRFAARRVRTGITAGGRTEILAGLAPGEEVVASGQFLLDSEANLREGLSRTGGAVGALDPETPLAGLAVDANALALIDHLTDMALYFHEALVDRYRIEPDFVAPALKIAKTLSIRYNDTKLEPIFRAAADAMADAVAAREGEGLEAALADLIAALQPWLLEGAPARYAAAGLALYADPSSGARWLQDGGSARNPYGHEDGPRPGDPAPEALPWPNAPPSAGASAPHDPEGPRP